MNISTLLTTPYGRKSGSQRGSGLRRTLCLLALVAFYAAGAWAQIPYSAYIYDGKQYSTIERNALKVLAYQGALSSVAIDGGTMYTKPDGTELVSVITSERIFKVPTGVTPANDMEVKLTTDTKNWAKTNANYFSNVSRITLHFQVAVNEQNFPDENFRNCVLAQEYGADSLLTKDEIAEVTSIVVSNKNIASLKGIEYFTELKELSCYDTQLNTLDVSKCTKLWFLNCSNNKITNLELSHNTALTILNCSHNKLTTLDMTNNTKLFMIACFDNQLRGSEMDRFVQSLPQVETGVVEVCSESDTEGNVITTIQVQAAKDKGWKVRTSSENDYEGVDPGIAINKTNFPDDRFRSYVLNNCDTDKDTYLSDEEIAEVTNINVFRLGITSLQGIEFFTELTTLACESNQLTALDVSGNTKLTSLECYGNQLTALNVSKNTKLTKLDCSVNKLNNLDVSNNTALTELNCGNNQLAALDVSNNVNLTSLSCGGNQLTTLDVSNCMALTFLNCSSNQIRGTSMTALVNGLPETGGTFYVIRDETATGNVMTTVQVEAAIAKSWTPMWFDGKRWHNYSGINVPGDANGDGEVNAKDIETLRDYILGLEPTPFSLESAHLNEDSVVDIVDVTLLIEMLKE